MRLIRAMCTTRFLALIVLLLPGLATASTSAAGESSALPALAAFDSGELTSLHIMTDDELDTVQGGWFNLGLNFVFAPQINVCVFCTGVSQSNFLVVFGLNDFGLQRLR